MHIILIQEQSRGKQTRLERVSLVLGLGTAGPPPSSLTSTAPSSPHISPVPASSRARRSPPSCGEEEAVRIRTQFSPQLESWKEKTAAQRWRPGAGPVRSSSSEELQSKSEHLHLHRLQQIRAQHCGFVAKNSSLS